MRAVKITTLVTTSQHGVLGPGDILRTSDAFAAHLVNDCRAALYLEAPVAADDQPAGAASEPAAGRRRRKG